ncbi:isoleucine--tRNA ligase [Mycoplasma sp. CSL7491-lung]|uniref:isoleucine--tRNA ligase n=1 Tax=Mycoplasma sp. CSL7491-lung TaxID=549718 RepID=UPI001C11C8AA|nr:isoleucine--tRNA ligase [Mycoplasma sp. CSL7491-lung]MBU4693204.1 isoleucine--tRNA ligase [Mycoplasma sp. CSL7491-lung]
MNYKKTLNMPKTDFEMRANLTQKESKFRELWATSEVYKKVLEKNKNNPRFILHDGPPYANGDIHVGHALNKILKDIIVRYKTLRGFYSPFVFGWDTHGLPIEHKMLTEAKLNKDELSPIIIRKKAAKYALKQVDKQLKQLELLQLFTNYDKKYITLDKKYEVKQLEVLKKLVFDGLIYKGLKPVYWSPSSQSALAESEVEYQDVVSPSIYVSFNVVSSTFKSIKPNDKIIIWTTTPWTLLANAGAALGEKIEYNVLSYQDQRYIVAKELLNEFVSKLNWEGYEILETFIGSEIENHSILYNTPITKVEAPLILGHHVTTESGTGIVHIAPMFGEDDYLIGKKYNLNMIMHISDKGYIENTNTQFDNIFYEDANKLIGQFLGSDLLHFSRFKHSYPHDWRTHKPIIYRGTPQWFVSIDKIRDKILSEIENNVTTYPEWAHKRLYNMILNRGDWTISRQRTWGVPLIFFYDQDKNPVFEEEIFDYVINLVSQFGTDVWWEKETDELLPEKYRGKGFTREMDIMDVWFDSGVSSIAVDIDDENGIKPPYDLYLEGTDQYRGWFNSSIINSVAFNGFAPYKKIVSHGFTVDKKGEKMSKSKGNVINPLDIVKKRGADILRLWVANSEYSNDISISDEILDQNTEIYRRIRNTIKFLLGNLNNFEYDSELERTGIHLYIKNQLENIKETIFKAYDEYKFINVIKILNNYIVDLSSFYLTITKDILYVQKIDNPERIMVLTNLYEITEFLVHIIAPILPTTSEEAFSFFNSKNKPILLMLSEYMNNNEFKYDNVILEKYQEFFELRDEVNVLIEKEIKSGLIKRSNEAHLILNTNSDLIKSLDLKTLLMVGKVTFDNTKETQIITFESLKCERCWNHFEENDFDKSNNICLSCSNIVKEFPLDELED